MLEKVINTSNVKFAEGPLADEQMSAIAIDLHKRLPRYKHTQKPSGSQAVIVTVSGPSSGDFLNFTYTLTYAKKDSGEFITLGNPVILESNDLPYPR